jgi:circadian clock protein KaiB
VPPEEPSGILRLRLYVAGSAPNSLRAVKNVTAICEAHFAGAYHLDVVDMIAEPARALADAVLVTPTLLKLEPAPTQRVVGNLDDFDRVLLLLGST